MRAGVTCYLGVEVEGALFSFGDGHARQGEGETCGVAVETAMDTVLILDLIKGSPTPWPRIESDDHIMTTGSTKPLEDATRAMNAVATTRQRMTDCEHSAIQRSPRFHSRNCQPNTKKGRNPSTRAAEKV